MKLKNTLLFITLATIMFGQSAVNAAAALADLAEIKAILLLNASAYRTWKNSVQCSVCPSFFIFIQDKLGRGALDDFHAFADTDTSHRTSDDLVKILQRDTSIGHCAIMAWDLEAKEHEAHLARMDEAGERAIAELKEFLANRDYRESLQKFLPLIGAGVVAFSGVFLNNAKAYRENSALIRDMRRNRDTLEKDYLCRIGVFKLSLNRAASFFADNAQRNGAASKDLMPRKLKLKYTPINEMLAYAGITKENTRAADATFQELQHKTQHNKCRSLNNMIISGLCLGLCVFVIIYIVQ